MSAKMTPAAVWREKGEPDPFGTAYDGLARHELAGGQHTDDELAHMCGMADGRSMQDTVVLTMAKERIRWLSRQLEAARSASTLPSPASSSEPGRTAYEARFAGFTLGPRGVAEKWEDLLPVHQAIWARVEEAVRAASRPVAEEPAGPMGEPLSLWRVVVCIPGMDIDLFLYWAGRPEIDDIQQVWDGARKGFERTILKPIGWKGPLRDAYPGISTITRLAVYTSQKPAAPKANGVGTGEEGL